MENRGSRSIRVELKTIIIHKCKIPGQHLRAGGSPSKITNVGKILDTDREEKERRRK